MNSEETFWAVVLGLFFICAAASDCQGCANDISSDKINACVTACQAQSEKMDRYNETDGCICKP